MFDLNTSLQMSHLPWGWVYLKKKRKNLLNTKIWINKANGNMTSSRSLSRQQDGKHCKNEKQHATQIRILTGNNSDWKQIIVQLAFSLFGHESGNWLFFIFTHWHEQIYPPSPGCWHLKISILLGSENTFIDGCKLKVVSPASRPFSSYLIRFDNWWVT